MRAGPTFCPASAAQPDPSEPSSFSPRPKASTTKVVPLSSPESHLALPVPISTPLALAMAGYLLVPFAAVVDSLERAPHVLDEFRRARRIQGLEHALEQDRGARARPGRELVERHLAFLGRLQGLA